MPLPVSWNLRSATSQLSKSACSQGIRSCPLLTWNSDVNKACCGVICSPETLVRWTWGEERILGSKHGQHCGMVGCQELFKRAFSTSLLPEALLLYSLLAVTKVFWDSQEDQCCFLTQHGAIHDWNWELTQGLSPASHTKVLTCISNAQRAPLPRLVEGWISALWSC